MKNVLLIALLFLRLDLYCQEKEPTYPVKDGKILYESVVLVDSATQDQLYQRCRAWFGKTFKSANAVLQMDTKDELIGKGISVYTISNLGTRTNINVEFMISVKIKDGRYKYEITDFHSVDAAWSMEDVISDGKVFKSNGKPRNVNMDYRTETIRTATNLIASLKLAMSESKEDGW
jgi:Domain of unknown function (DUF4468) with TBP-like fold